MERYVSPKCSGLYSVDNGKPLESFKQQSAVISSMFYKNH